MKDQIRYSLSAGNWGDGKSVCLWRTTGTEGVKIAKFLSDDVARKFAKDFGFPLSDTLKKRFSDCES